MRALYSIGRSVPLSRVLRDYRAALWPLGIVLAINVAVLGVVVLPLSQRVTTNEQRAIAAERQRAVAEADFRRTEGLRDGKVRATEDLETFYRDILPATTAAGRRILQLRLLQQAREHNVRFEGGGTTEEEVRDSPLLRLTMQMRLSGDYDDIRGFLYELETAPDFLVIDNIKLAEGVGQDAPLAVSLDVSTYYRTAPAPAAVTSDGR